MFNAMTQAELLAAVGRTMRLAAGQEGELAGYQRSQLLSAYSVTRLMASEQAAADELLHWFQTATARALAGDDRPDVRAAQAGVSAARNGVQAGGAVSALLTALPGADPTRARLHAVLAELADREVRALDTPAT